MIWNQEIIELKARIYKLCQTVNSDDREWDMATFVYELTGRGKKHTPGGKVEPFILLWVGRMYETGHFRHGDIYKECLHMYKLHDPDFGNHK